MRITAGSLRGRRIQHAKKTPEIRPTTSRVREALFNIIGTITDATVLDCFAGSGVMAVESLSRGAAHATSIEQQSDAVRNMQQLSAQWQLTDRWRIHHADVACALSPLANRYFSLIFADPPYHSDWSQQLPQLLIQHRITTDHFVMEEASDATVAWPPEATLISSRRYGESTLHFLQLQEQTDP